MIKLNKMEQMNITLLLLLLFLHYYPAHTTLETFSQIELHLQESVVNSMKMLSMVYIRIFLIVGTKASEGYICS